MVGKRIGAVLANIDPIGRRLHEVRRTAEPEPAPRLFDGVPDYA